ncbi:hypothetical protein AMELA_G00004140 [Ameiurus melas]|uniref:Uncharacterized protein n=1 Tax=Ameiurus melas TaxID=219545 RepID=A0A7J6BHA6_AMEME|nr:hypothetical protein AMELA_G00004140 [Ameiurus melas]
MLHFSTERKVHTRPDYNSQNPSLTCAPLTQTVPTPQKPANSCLLLITSAGGRGEIWRVKSHGYIALWAEHYKGISCVSTNRPVLRSG